MELWILHICNNCFIVVTGSYWNLCHFNNPNVFKESFQTNSLTTIDPTTKLASIVNKATHVCFLMYRDIPLVSSKKTNARMNFLSWGLIPNLHMSTS